MNLNGTQSLSPRILEVKQWWGCGDRGINGGAVDLLLRETRVHRRGTYVATLRKSRGKSSLKRWSVTRKLGLESARWGCRVHLIDEWIKKLCYINIMEHCPALKRNTFESVLMRWMNLEPILQSEVNKKETNIIYEYIFMGSRKMVLMNLFAKQ